MNSQNLYQEIEALLNEVKKTHEKEINDIQDIEKKLSEEDSFRLALRTGAKIPDFNLPNVHGKQVNIVDLYSQKPIVLVFYRGEWCPFCNLQLRSLQRHLSEIKNSPANLVAISPQTPDHSLSTVEKLALEFEVLSDVGGKVGKKFNLVYTLPEYLNETYKKFGVELEHYNGKGQIQLFYPATYVINQEGIIIMDFVKPNLHDRLEPKEVVDFLKTL